MSKFLQWLGATPKKTVPDNGLEAHKQGYKMEDNPFRQHTPNHSIWRDEWLDASGRFQ